MSIMRTNHIVMADTDEAGLLHDICFHPDDMSLRLIFADYCEDKGDMVRAEFIRTSVELHQIEQESIERQGYLDSLNSAISSPVDWRLHYQRQKLVNHCDHLLDVARSLDISNHDSWVFQPAWMGHVNWIGGFVGKIMLAMQDWIKHGVYAVLRYPIQSLSFYSLTGLAVQHLAISDPGVYQLQLLISKDCQMIDEWNIMLGLPIRFPSRESAQLAYVQLVNDFPAKCLDAARKLAGIIS